MRLAGLIVMSGIAVMATAAPALAHGGTHATPWPTPTTSTYSYTPQTYFPTYYPSAPSTPSPTTPTVPTNPGTTPGAPTSPTPGTTSNPSVPTGPGSGPGTQPGGPQTPTGPTSSTPQTPTGPTSGPQAPTSTPGGPTSPNAPSAPTGTPGTPQAPTAPGSPTVPTPGAPGAPGGPTNPGGTPNPGGPTSPVSPTSPGSNPGAPTSPMNPVGPTTPQPAPGTPSTPGGSYPGVPTVPTGTSGGVPKAPGTSGVPGAPSAPNQPYGPTRGRPSGAPSKGEVARSARDARERWEAWWQQNQWRFVRTVQRRATQTGAHGVSDGADAGLATWLMKEALTDQHFDPRSAAALALGKLHATEAAKELNKLMATDKNDFVRESSALALGMMQSTGSVPNLVSVLADTRNKDRLRMHAAVGLGFMQDPSAVPALMRLLGGRDDLEVMVAATVALGLIGDDSATNALLTVARHRRLHAAVRSAAIAALGKIGPKSAQGDDILTVLRKIYTSDKERDARRAVALVLYRFDQPGVMDELVRIGNNDQDRLVRSFSMLSLAEAAYTRGDAGDRARARALFEARLRGGAEVEKGYAAIALGLLGRSDRACAAPLRAALKAQSNESNVAACCIGLGLMQDLASRQEIGAIAMGNGQPDLRGYACVALGLMGGSDARIVTFLTEMVQHCTIPEVRAAAALALSKIGSSPEALAALRTALGDRNRYFKMSAIVALGYFRDFATVKDLQTAFAKESSAETRAMVVVALGYIGETTDLPVLRSLSVDFNYLSVFQTLPNFDQLLGLF